MSDRYQGSAYRGRGGPYREDRRYPPRHHPRDEYPDSRAAYDSRDPYASTYYPEPRGYSDRPPRRVHKTIPPPRPWDYSRRPPPRNEQERIELEREREAWEAKEAERYEQRMAERDRERQRDYERSGGSGAYGPAGGWRERELEAEAYERERARLAGDLGPARRPRSRSPGQDPRPYQQRDSWSRASVGSAEGREREMPAAPAERLDGPSGYPARRSSPPPPSSAAASHIDAPDGPSASRHREAPVDRPISPQGTPRGPARDYTGFASTPPTGPRASRGGPPPAYPSSAFRGREGSGSTGPYTPGSERDSYMSPSANRFGRSARDGPPPPTGPYRGGHPSFGRGRRDTNPYDYHGGGGPEDDLGGYRGGYAGSSPHESPYSPSTAGPGPGGAAHPTAARLSRTSSSQNPPTPTTLHPPTNASSALASPSTLTAPVSAAPRFSSAANLTPDLDAELLALETQRSAFISNYLLGAKRANLRAGRLELRDAELESGAAAGRRVAAERALEIARETADSYSLEENRKEELMRVMAAQLESGGAVGQVV